MCRVADILGKLWASPCTLLGLLWGGLGYLLSKLHGGRPQLCFGNNAVQFIGNAGVFARSALVMGNVIIYGRNAYPGQCGVYGDACVQLGRHEQAHTFQYQVLGVLFIPVYLIAATRGVDHNPFEIAAQRFGSGQGSWWP